MPALSKNVFLATSIKFFFSLGLELFRFSHFKNDTLSEMFSAMEVFAVSTLRKKGISSCVSQ